MKKYLSIIAFFVLLEYQVFWGNGGYSAITAAGLVLLCVYELLTEDKKISFRDSKKVAHMAPAGGSKDLKFTEKAAVAVYAAVVAASVIFGAFGLGQGSQFAFILLGGVLAITAISLRENRELRQQKGAGAAAASRAAASTAGSARTTSSATTALSSFTIPKLLIIAMNFLLSTLIHQNFAYQSILILSCLVLFDIFAHGENAVAKAKKGEIAEHEFKHMIFHRSSKYWNFFLTVWFIIALQSNNLISPTIEYLMLFAFMVMFLVFLVETQTGVTKKDFFVIVLLSSLMASLSPLSNKFFGGEIPGYLLASLILVAFDTGSLYFHQREFPEESTTKYWSQKMAVYFLMGIYIAQLNFMMTHSFFGIDQIMASVLGH
jgi:hypothetical protein